MYSSPVPEVESTGVMPLHSYIVEASLHGSAICPIQFPKLYLQTLDLYQFTLYFKPLISVCETLNVLQMHMQIEK